MSIIIIGAGQVAASLCAKYRALGGDKPITILGDEPYHPYQRPPLSKKYLAGEMELERLFLRPPDWYGEQGVTCRLNSRVAALDPKMHKVKLEAGEELSYDKLVLATGSRARHLPTDVTQNAGGIYSVRSIADVDLMRAEFVEGRKLLVIGGGYIGLEAAAIARKFKVEVTLIEAAPRILGRVASEETADFIRQMHQSHGVEIIEGIGIETLTLKAGKFTGARLEDGRDIQGDFAIIGIGIEPNSELAEAAGLACDNGILIDAHCRTSDPHIFAAGDCARFEFRAEKVRLESVGNAIDQGEIVAANLAGERAPYIPKPWFWSDQYDLSLQIAGLNLGYDDTISRAGPREGTKSVWYYRGDTLLAVDAMGDPRAYMIAKRLIEGGKSLPKNVAGDASIDLKEWL